MRLQTKLAILGTGTALLAVLLVTSISNFSTRSEISKIIARDERDKARETMDRVRLWHDTHRSWDNVDQLFMSLAASNHQQLLLLDGSDRCVASFPVTVCKMRIVVGPHESLKISSFSEQHLDVTELAGVPEAIITDGEGKNDIRKLFVLPSGVEAPNSPVRFFASMSRSLWIGGGIAAAVGLCLSFVLTRTLLRPIRDLSMVALSMEKGDFSRRVNAYGQAEIDLLGEAFNSLAVALERQEELRKELFHDVAHELRTPLTNIRCQVESVQDGLAEATPETLKSIYEETMLLSRLVDDLRDIALAEAGQLRLDIEDFDAVIELRQAIRSFLPVAKLRSIEMNLDTLEALPLTADRGRFSQIVNNLLANAIQHARHRVDVKAKVCASILSIEVQDDGNGILPQHLPYIFDRFYRADPNRARASGGTGLGLAIVKQLVELQGGSIEASTTVGHGSRFSLTLPAWAPVTKSHVLQFAGPWP